MGLNFTGLKFTDLKSDIENYLKKEYKKAGILFGVASPYGQILNVVENLHQLSMIYLKNALTGLDLTEPNMNNERVIRNAAINAGHIPTRAIAASGTLVVSVNPGTDLEREVAGAKITIFNKTKIRNITNGLDYSISLGKDSVTHMLTPGYRFFINITQGAWKSQTFTGTGAAMKTFVVDERNGTYIDNFQIEVYVNGILWEKKRHIYDMIPDEMAYVAKSGYNDSLEIVFGNGGFGMIPKLGTEIEVRFLKNDGEDGNIYRRTKKDWDVIDSIIDGSGNGIDFTKIFNVEFYTDINFGAEPEDFMFTKQMVPFVTNNAVLALPQHFAYEIKKLGVFSHVNAYEKTGTIFITVTPNINLFKNQGANYFTIDKQAFILDNFEKSKIDKYLKGNGLIQLTKKYKVITPKLSYYAINIYIIPYSDAMDESVNAEILSVVSDYFLNLNRTERIPKVDIIKLLSRIKDLHSVDIYFISKKNEDYHKNGMLQATQTSQKYEQSINYDSNFVLGIDPMMGDLLFEADELPLIRGGWSDRNGSLYSDDIDSNGLSAVNIIRKGTVDAKNRAK